MADAPVVRAGRARMERRVAVGVLAEHPKETRLAELTAVARRRAALFRADSPTDQRAQRVARVPGRDVDDAVDRVRAPQARARTANHLDALDVLQQIVLHVPLDSGKQRRVDTARVAQHEQFLGVDAAECARADRPRIRVASGDVQSGDAAQRFRNGSRARAPDVFVGHDTHRGRRRAQCLGGARYRRDLDVHQLLDAQPFQRAGGCSHVLRCGCVSGGTQQQRSCQRRGSERVGNLAHDLSFRVRVGGHFGQRRRQLGELRRLAQQSIDVLRHGLLRAQALAPSRQ